MCHSGFIIAAVTGKVRGGKTSLRAHNARHLSFELQTFLSFLQHLLILITSKHIFVLFSIVLTHIKTEAAFTVNQTVVTNHS